jgi:hypothetical protein
MRCVFSYSKNDSFHIQIQYAVIFAIKWLETVLLKLNGLDGKRPCKSNRPKERAKILDDFDHCVINRTIHGLYSWKIAPTVSIIHKEIKDSNKISKMREMLVSFV